ncbi:H/ACA ribonucleoprotein complex subunit GAR1 [Vulcanisaeta souniana]|uniref:H/ACA RNA-protein complex protein Gar1 n=1 Tax=Vulcanisaeta souniana JCM 11219 TaxID=1293586 RepID=A0A830DZ80_9CREN|nr:Gar1/Naf1 family protein [Vulcanisaeta souniana]BDR92204.1 H/ACA RNA-protein complex protein Gar1 [Vulcanisaeta souniana JCM 11219]GGI67117.1 H/ACA RNA-protein complex protein Gar1 [Vulcanisaeta souniana JCM 11219]
MFKKIGDVLHVSQDRRFVLKLAFVPPLGITVYDYAMRRVGKLYDVIGPVKSPYGLIKPDPQVSNPGGFVGKSVYVRDIDLRRRGRGGGHGHGK